MEYSALDIARYIINLCMSIGRPISNLQLQKILYFVQGEYFRATGRFLMPEDFYAWQLGPVQPEVYDEYCVYGGGKIYEASDVTVCEDVRRVIDPVIASRANQTAAMLVNETHRRGTAWDQVYNGIKWTVIPKVLIERDFAG